MIKQQLVDKIIGWTEAANEWKFRPYQRKSAKQVIESILIDAPGILTRLWSRKSGKTDTLKMVMSALMAILPGLARSHFAKDFPRLKLFRSGFQVAFAAPKEQLAQLPFKRLRKQARQKHFLKHLNSLDVYVQASNSSTFELSNESIATAFSGSETADNEGEGAHCLVGETIIQTDQGPRIIADIVQRHRNGEEQKILSVGKSGLEYKKCLAVFSGIHKDFMVLSCSNGQKLKCSLDHPIFVNNLFKKACQLEVKEEIYSLSSEKLSSVQLWVMAIFHKLGKQFLDIARSRKNGFSGNITNSPTWSKLHQGLGKIEDGEKKYGNSALLSFQNSKYSDQKFTSSGENMLFRASLINLLHLALQYGGKMMEVIKMELEHSILKDFYIVNILFFKNIFRNSGILKLKFNPFKNVREFFIFLYSLRLRTFVSQNSLLPTFCLVSDTRFEGRNIVKYVENKLSREDAKYALRNVKKKEKKNMMQSSEKRIREHSSIFASFVETVSQIKKISQQKLVQLSALVDGKIKFFGRGDLRLESFLTQKVHITQIEHFTQETKLFDLMVEENHNYFANGFLVHNCLILDESQKLSPFSVYKILRPMVAHCDGLIIEIGTAFRKKGPFKADIEYNKRKFPDLHQKVLYTDVTPFSKWYASYIDKEIDRLPGGKDNPAFKMNYLLEWLIAEGHFVDPDKFIELNTAYRGPSGGKLVAGVDWGKVESSTAVTILESQNGNTAVVDLFEIKGDWDHQFDYLVPFLKDLPLAKIFSEATGAGDPLTTRLAKELGKNKVEGKFMSAPYKDQIFTTLQTEITAKVKRFSYFEDDTKESKNFVRQFLDAEQELHGNMLVVHKPKEEGSADDFLFSTALAMDALQTTPSGKIEYKSTGEKRGVLTALENF